MTGGPHFEAPPQAMPPKRTNTLIWVLLIVGVGGLCLVTVLFAAILFPVFSQARFAAHRTKCLNNVKQLTLGHTMYLSDFDGRFAPKEGWDEVLSPYVVESGAWTCPIVRTREGSSASGYAYNAALSGVEFDEIAEPERTVVVFESGDTTMGKFGGMKDIVNPGRHGDLGTGFGLCDSSARFQFGDASGLLWKP